MENRDIKAIISKLPQSFNLVFKKDASLFNIGILLILHDEGKIILKESGLIRAVWREKSLKGLPNHTTQATLNPEVMHDTRFVDRIGKDLERITPVIRHPLNDLMAKKEKIRKAAIDRYINEGLAIMIPERLGESGLSFKAEVPAPTGPPKITFKLVVTSSGKVIGSYTLDALGYLTIIGSKKPAKIYNGPRELREAVMEDMIIYLEKETNPKSHSFT